MLAIVVVACSGGKPASSSDSSSANLVDEITAVTTRSDLVSKYGAANVVDTVIYLAEGEMSPGAVLFPGDSMRRVEITWKDAGSMARPATIHLNGTASTW